MQLLFLRRVSLLRPTTILLGAAERVSVSPPHRDRADSNAFESNQVLSLGIIKRSEQASLVLELEACATHLAACQYFKMPLHCLWARDSRGKCSTISAAPLE